MQPIAAEIQSYLAHNDFDVAKRRLLDATYQNGDLALMQKTITACKNLNQSNQYEGLQSLAGEVLAQINFVTPSTSTELLSATALTKNYNKGVFALTSTQPLQINSGNIIGVVGENGNGKTTLLRTLAGQLAVNSGNVNYSVLGSSNYYSIKNYVVFIPQRIPRWFGLLKDNLHFSASLAGRHGTENEVLVNFLMERLGLTKYANYSWNSISSGYRTRFEIARVLLQKPQLLILDEPLANLDINAQQTLLTDLKFIVKTWNEPLAIVLSSQQLHEVEKIADSIIFVKNGNCILNPVQNTEASTTIVEVEVDVPREKLAAVLTGYTLQFNGGLYTITSTQPNQAAQIIMLLLQNNLPVKYFRDITYSTKKLFN
jgi:ABC-2 type transport system ATP-binding protein